MPRADKTRRRLGRGEVDKEKTNNKRSYFFPEEILREICLRLPVKTLLRFRSVEKRMQNLISTQRFATNHLNTFRPKEDRLLLLHPLRPNDIGLCIYLNGVVPTHVEDIPPPSGAFAGYEEVRVVHYCNGVACLISMHNVLFLNPSIRKVVAIPRLQVNARAMGFGFDSVDDDYKFVVINYTDKRGAPLKANVFSLKTRNWATVTLSRTQRMRHQTYLPLSAFVNGAFHWLTLEFEDDATYAIFVLSFHLGGDHVTNRFAVPSSPSRYDQFSIRVYEGCLSLIIWKREQPKNLEMWVMKEYADVGSWTRIIESAHISYEDDIVGFTRGGDIVYRRARHLGPQGWTEAELTCYNPTSKTTRSLKEDHHGGLYCGLLGTYRESLVLLNQN